MTTLYDHVALEHNKCIIHVTSYVVVITKLYDMKCLCGT